MYLLFIVHEEGSYARKFSSLKEAKSFFKDAKRGAPYNIAVALYDWEKDSRFGLSDYGFVGEPIEEWENENF
jgi:hypothetical protein